MNEAKSLVGSKTFQLAFVQAVIAIVVIFSSAYPEAGWLLIGKSFLDVLLRYITTQPVTSVLPPQS